MTLQEIAQRWSDSVEVEPTTLGQLLHVRARRAREDAELCDALLDGLRTEVLELPLELTDRIFT
jgi:hypothetical protein